MKFKETELPGVILFEPRVFGDARGYFVETWRENTYREAGIEENFVQDNQSFSQRGVLRGLHFQLPLAQGKLVSAAYGEVFDVAVDIRHGSPNFGQWVGVTLSAELGQQLYIPPGFAHGFCVTSETALFSYKCTQYYDPVGDAGIRWDDPDIGIQWPIERAEVSGKDAVAPMLRELTPEQLPSYPE